jgi:hypothetical protein
MMVVVVVVRVDTLGGCLGRGVTWDTARLIAALIAAIAGAGHLQAGQ